MIPAWHEETIWVGKNTPYLGFLPMAGAQCARTVGAELVGLVLTARGKATVVNAVDASTGLAFSKEASAACMRKG